MLAYFLAEYQEYILKSTFQIRIMHSELWWGLSLADDVLIARQLKGSLNP